MTSIPDAAVEAMFDAMETAPHDPFTTDPLFGSPDQIRAAIRDGLAAALPFLTERTQYRIVCAPPGHQPIDVEDLDEARRQAAGLDCGPRIESRLVGEWTEVQT